MKKKKKQHPVFLDTHIKWKQLFSCNEYFGKDISVMIGNSYLFMLAMNS